MALLQPDPWYDAIPQIKLERKSKNKYTNDLKKLRSLSGGLPTEAVITFCTKLQTFLLERELLAGKRNAHSVRGMANAIKAVVKHIVPNEFKAAWAPEIEAWERLHRLATKMAEMPAQAGKATPAQVKGYVPWGRVIECRDALPYGSRDHLMLCMWTMIPPLRLDYRAVKIVRSLGELSGWEGSYLLLCGEGSFLHTMRPNKVFGDSAYARGIKASLPHALVDAVEASLSLFPRNYLFTKHNSKDKLFSSDESFGNCVRDTLKAAVGNKKIGVSILRHIYVVAMYSRYSRALEGTEGPQAEAHARCEVAKAAFLMAHSLKMHRLYRFDVSEEGEAVPMEGSKLTKHDVAVLSAAERCAPLSVASI